MIQRRLHGFSGDTCRDNRDFVEFLQLLGPGQARGSGRFRKRHREHDTAVGIPIFCGPLKEHVSFRQIIGFFKFRRRFRPPPTVSLRESATYRSLSAHLAAKSDDVLNNRHNRALPPSEAAKSVAPPPVFLLVTSTESESRAIQNFDYACFRANSAWVSGIGWECGVDVSELFYVSIAARWQGSRCPWPTSKKRRPDLLSPLSFHNLLCWYPYNHFCQNSEADMPRFCQIERSNSAGSVPFRHPACTIRRTARKSRQSFTGIASIVCDGIDQGPGRI